MSFAFVNNNINKTRMVMGPVTDTRLYILSHIRNEMTSVEWRYKQILNAIKIFISMH